MSVIRQSTRHREHVVRGDLQASGKKIAAHYVLAMTPHYMLRARDDGMFRRVIQAEYSGGIFIWHITWRS
jgi:hypothetical protein